MTDEMFFFKLSQGNILISDNKGLLYCSNIKRVFSDLHTYSFELFIFYEICEYNVDVINYKFEFCKCFLNFAKEINR